MYLTEYWNDDDGDEEIVFHPRLNGPKKVVTDCETEKKEPEETEACSN